MTNEEAIKTLRELWRETNDTWYEEVYNMAIEALSAEAVQGVGRYENAMQKLRDMPRYLNGVKEKQITKVSANNTTKKPNDIVDSKNDVVAEPTDLISRADAVEAVHKYFVDAFNNEPHEIDDDGDDVFTDMKSVNALLHHNKHLSKALKALPSAEAEPKTDEEDDLKFYYVESIDDYWIGARLDNFYYADWHKGLGFVWSHSKYLPWGQHIVDENTLWKEHTYPSEPIEMQFTDWIVGFVKKYFAEPKTGEWIMQNEELKISDYRCSECGHYQDDKTDYCPNCGAKMGSDTR